MSFAPRQKRATHLLAPALLVVTVLLLLFSENAFATDNDRVCTTEGLASSTESMGLNLEFIYGPPKNYVTHLKNLFLRNVYRGNCFRTNLNATLTYVNGTAWDSSPSRAIDTYYSSWADTAFYQSFNETTQAANTVPRVDNITAFCALHHANCSVGGSDPTCPAYCTRNPSTWSNSMRNAELCFWDSIADLMNIFMNEGLVQSVWLQSTLGVGLYLPVRSDIFDIVADINEWSNAYAYANDIVYNPTKAFVWSPPYIDPFLAGNIVSGTAPVYFQNFFFGVFGVDLLIGSNLLDTLLGNTPTPSGFSVLVTETGAIISATERGWTTLLGPNLDKTDISNTILNSVYGNFSQLVASFPSLTDDIVSSMTLPLNGSELHYIAYRRIKAINWYLVAVSSEAELLRAASVAVIGQDNVFVKIFQDETYDFSFIISNTGNLELTNDLAMTFPEGRWATFIDSGNASYTVTIPPMSNRTIRVRVAGANLTSGEYFTLVSISTKDLLHGWCYSRLSNIKLSLSLHQRVDTFIYPVASSGSGVFFSIFAAALIVAGLFLGAIIWKYRAEDVIRASSVNFCLIIIFGSLLVYISTFLWLERPTSRTCMGRAWLGFVGFSLVLGCLTAKNFRIWKIFQNAKMKRIKLSDQYLFLIVMVLLSFDLIVLVVWEIVDPLQPYLYTSSILEENEVFYDCNSSYLSTWIGILFAEKLALVVFGCVLAFKTRNQVLDKYNESKIIGFSMYNILIIMTLSILLVAMLDSSVQVTFSFVAIGLLVPVGCTMLALLVPKLMTLAGFLKASSTHGSSLGNNQNANNASANRSQHSESKPEAGKDSIPMPRVHSSASSVEPDKV